MFFGLMINRKVFVSGCFDLLHAGHVEFLNLAAEYGNLYVGIGSDKNIRLLKNVNPTYNQNERLFILNNLKSVKEAFVCSGYGMLDFVEDLRRVKPDFFIVNEDGDTREKRKLCHSLNIEYKVLKRIPKQGLPKRSSTELRKLNEKI